VHAGEPGHEAHRHEQADLHLADRHADRTGGRRVPATEKIQLPMRVRSRIHVASSTKTIQ
jgi:hypothetical protein